MFLGLAIGDALGMPAETLTRREIQKRFGRIDKYIEPRGHKWFDGKPAGMWTDDTQLTLAVADSFIDKGQFDMDDIAVRHVKALKESDLGWGSTTREAVQRLSEGTHWNISGYSTTPLGRGIGNGVAMKIAPLAAYLTTRYRNHELSQPDVDDISRFAFMTHSTGIGAASALAHIEAIYHCLTHTRRHFFDDEFLKAVIGAAKRHNTFTEDNSDSERDKLLFQLGYVDRLDWSVIPVEAMLKVFNGGTSKASSSLPFSYAMFLRNVDSIDAIYETVNAGGDTDSNGAIVGSLLGALYGEYIFPAHLVNELWQKNHILEIADRFCAVFGIV
ncbi:ADP-ribosylglycohydrolase family protein [Candidatus Peregrinibacteria bacterium]|nr:ADP-ribosylglycohydrolase family protein [Candidatus Peregrinibacteria bacterium]